MAQLLLAHVFDHGFHADLHGGVEGAVDAGLEDEEIADADWCDEIKVIHRGSDDKGARVAAGGHGADEIHELHESPAEEVAEGIAVGGKDDLAAFGLGGADGTRIGAVGHSSIVIGTYCIWREGAAS